MGLGILAGVLVVVGVCAGLVFLYALQPEITEDQLEELRTTGMFVQARVTAIVQLPTGRVDDDPWASLLYRIEASWTEPSSGTTREFIKIVAKGTAERYQAGSSVGVYFDPKRPSRYFVAVEKEVI